MKKNKHELERIQTLIKNDRLNTADDFSELLTGDINRVLKEYFDYNGYPKLSIEKNGTAYSVEISVSVTAVRRFSSVPNDSEKY